MFFSLSPDNLGQMDYDCVCMSFKTRLDRSSNAATFQAFLLVLMIQSLSSASAFALPRRLILALDGISYRDMKALQAGMSYTDLKGRRFHRQAFNDGFFPVSRNISTFPSTSDVAWTDMFGDRPLPGYQRTYFSEAENRVISMNSLTSSMERERQVNWQMESGYRRAMGYVYPLHCFKYELREMAEKFLNCKSAEDNYYAYVRSTDDAQHTSGDIFAMLCMLDEKLKDVRAAYQAREGRELEILILSDHGNNHAGAGQRVQVRAFLENAGYRVGKSIMNSNEVVLPTCGIQSWVEIHNTPSETERLAQLLWRLEGVDLVTARIADHSNQFLVINSKGERAIIERNAAKDSFRYSTGTGDPLDYSPVVAALANKSQLDANGFATADNWMAATMTHRYPLALERIAQGLTHITLNPATILLSLSNGYVNAGWLVKKSSQLMTLGGTHGGLDDLDSDGIVLSSFAPTKDTSTSRVAALFDDFHGLQNYRALENGAEWVTGKEQALTRIARVPFDSACKSLSGDGVFLRIWTPAFAHLNIKSPVEVTIERAPRFSSARIHRWDARSGDMSETHLTLDLPVSFSDQYACDRAYVLPPALILEPGKAYRISGRAPDQENHLQIFNFVFRTDSRGMPVAY
ncbi:MAG: hypothetical protein JWQ04_1872 [Pedosphaera sp.]|nr:hypothetical protein [Pedosphaera sp.]